MPPQVDFTEPQRAESHLRGAWKESLIRDAGGNSNLTCIMPDISFPFKSCVLLHTSKENFLRYRRLTGGGLGGEGGGVCGGVVRMSRTNMGGQRGEQRSPLRVSYSTQARRLLTLRRKANKET